MNSLDHCVMRAARAAGITLTPAGTPLLARDQGRYDDLRRNIQLRAAASGVRQDIADGIDVEDNRARLAEIEQEIQE